MTLAALVALPFLPHAMVNGDEYYYAGQALTLIRGRVLPVEGDPLPIPLMSPGEAVRYPAPWPAMLAPARRFSFRAMFLVPLLLHLAGGAAVARMLVRRGAASWLCVVYLFHPVFWIYSRTLMSDLPAVVALLLFMDFWEEGAGPQAAAAGGCVVALRTAGVVVFSGMALALFPSLRHRRRNLVWIGIAVLVAVVASVGFNYLARGRLLGSSYASGNLRLLNGHMAAENLALYAGGLLLIPPFPLVFVIARPRLVDRWVLAIIPILLFFILYSYHDTSPRLLETVIGGQRLIMGAHALALIATARVWSSAAALRRPGFVLAGGAAAGLIGCLAMGRLELGPAAAVHAVASCHPAAIAYNMNAARVAGSVEASEYRLLEADGAVARSDVAVLSRRMQSNRRVGGEAEPVPSVLLGMQDRCRRVGDYLIFDLEGRCPGFGQACDLPGH